MRSDHIATASTVIEAPAGAVWKALVTPTDIKQYMFGTTVDSQWKVGSAITWSGEWKGKPYQDKGKILTIVPQQTLSYSHFSPLSGQPDRPENYHTVTISLVALDAQTRVTLTQDGNATADEQKHAEENWSTMLKGLKEHVEKARPRAGSK